MQRRPRAETTIRSANGSSSLSSSARESLATLRDDIAELRERLDDSERNAEELPHREKYLLLVVDFLRGLLDLHEQLVDEVERVFPAPGGKRSTPAKPKTSKIKT
jgi:hypothetical protein